MDVRDDDGSQPVAELVGGLADFVEQVGDPERGMTMTVTDLRVRLPLELAVGVGEGGAVTLQTSTPQRTETSFSPALHSLNVRIVLNDGY